MKNTGLPQAGIITTLDTANSRAKVFLPLFKIETDWIPVASNLLYETSVNMQEVSMDTVSASTVQASAGTVGAGEFCPGSFSSWAAEEMSADLLDISSASINNITYGSMKVGDEVVVVFLNGDVNQGRVIARF